MELKEQILVALGLKKEEVNLGWQSKAEDGTIFVSTLDALEVSGDISVLTEDGSTIPVPAGEYSTPDGGFIVVEEGVIAEVLEAEAVEEETEEVVEEEVVEAAEEGDMETRVASLEKAVAELMEKLAEDEPEYKEEVEVEEEVEASKVRGTAPKSIKTTEVVEFNKLKAEIKRLKAELSKKPADSPINTNKFSSEKWVATKKDLSKMSQQDRFLYNLNK
jgi:uncharacterized small protein (DUF1192 family)